MEVCHMNEDWKAICAIAVCLLIVCGIVYFVHRIVLSGAEIARDNKVIGAMECIAFVCILGFLLMDEVFSKAMMFFHQNPGEQVSLLWKISVAALAFVGSVGIYVTASVLM